MQHSINEHRYSDAFRLPSSSIQTCVIPIVVVSSSTLLSSTNITNAVAVHRQKITATATQFSSTTTDGEQPTTIIDDNCDTVPCHQMPIFPFSPPYFSASSTSSLIVVVCCCLTLIEPFILFLPSIMEQQKVEE
ncbi:hypothetical protein ACH3XW_35025 [Acanthocheilonema viteae]